MSSFFRSLGSKKKSKSMLNREIPEREFLASPDYTTKSVLRLGYYKQWFKKGTKKGDEGEMARNAAP